MTEKPEWLIESQKIFEDWCQKIRAAGAVAFDTEFVSEDTYRPELCLLQLCVDGECLVVDPYSVSDLTPWWEIMLAPEILVCVHGGREEVRFCQQATGQFPQNLIDVQVWQGLLSAGYPLSYTNLVSQVLKKRTGAKQTRTDWRKRPLTIKQLEYAREDVRHLLEIVERQTHRLQQLKRGDWAQEEQQRQINDLERELQRERWTTLPKVHQLNRREQAIVRLLTEWREKQAEQENHPVRKILRDDFLIDLAHRQPRTETELLATRGMKSQRAARRAAELLDCIQRGLAIPENELPIKKKKQLYQRDPGLEVLQKLLSLALAQKCAEYNISTGLVGTAQDISDWIQWSLNPKERVPLLATGWRKEAIEPVLNDLLAGRLSIRVHDCQSSAPLQFEKVPPADCIESE